MVEIVHDVFQGIADPSRRRILEILHESERSIAYLTSELPVTRNAVKKHLNILEDSGLVSKRKEGRETIYTLRSGRLGDIVSWMRYFDVYWDEKLNSLKDYAERKGDL